MSRSNRPRNIFACLTLFAILIADAISGQTDDFPQIDPAVLPEQPAGELSPPTEPVAAIPEKPIHFEPVPSDDLTASGESRTPIAPISPEHASNAKSAGVVKTLVNLLLALAVGFLLFYFLKKTKGPVANRLPKEIFESIGDLPCTGKAKFKVVRFGSKLLLLAVGVERIEPLAELTDPHEVAALMNCFKNTDTLRKGKKE